MAEKPKPKKKEVWESTDDEDDFVAPKKELVQSDSDSDFGVSKPKPGENWDYIPPSIYSLKVLKFIFFSNFEGNDYDSFNFKQNYEEVKFVWHISYPPGNGASLGSYFLC